MRAKRAMTINRRPEELYDFWRHFENLPRFMRHVESVETENGGGRSHWRVKGPAGRTVEWDAEITADTPNELIAWRTTGDADVENQGCVRFEPAPGDRGTVVEVEMRYDPPAGVLGASFAKLFGEDPQWQLQDDLRRFKQVMETGEVITTEGQPAGRDSSTSAKYDTAIRE